jgi:sugar phosphate permease
MPGSRALAAICAADLLVALDGMIERRVRAPMVRLAVLRHRPLTGANLSLAANAGGFVGMTFMATLYMQQVLGYSPLEAGLGFLPLALSAGAGGLIAPWIVARAGARRTATASLVLTAAAFAYLARVPDENGYAAVLLPAFLLAGFTFATAFVPLTSQGLTGVREGEKGLASGLLQTSTHLGGAFVLTVLATTAAARTGASLDAGEPAAAALTSGFALAFLVAAGILVLGALAAVRTLPARG